MKNTMGISRPLLAAGALAYIGTLACSSDTAREKQTSPASSKKTADSMSTNVPLVPFLRVDDGGVMISRELQTQLATGVQKLKMRVFLADGAHVTDEEEAPRANVA